MTGFLLMEMSLTSPTPLYQFIKNLEAFFLLYKGINEHFWETETGNLENLA